MFRGSGVAIITPFRHGQIDYDGYARLLDIHAEARTDAVVVCGTTGESATLTHKEHKQLIKFTVDYLKEKAKTTGFRPEVVAGTGSNSTAEAVELTASAKADGADSCLLICPYYNKPPQRGALAHFLKVAEEVDLPIILYNVPSRVGMNLEVDTIVEASQHPRIQGVKEASGNLVQASEIIRRTAPDFMVYSGEDALNYLMMTLGGHGSISVVANVLPDELKKLHEAALGGQWEEARQWHHKLMAISKGLFLETNPVPVKAAVELLHEAHEAGRLSRPWPSAAELRLPLVPMLENLRTQLVEVLRKYDLPV